MDETQKTVADLEASVTGGIADVIGSLRGDNPPPGGDNPPNPQGGNPPPSPQGDNPPPGGDNPPPNPQGDNPPEAKGYTEAPTTVDTLRGMFSRKTPEPVSPGNIEVPPDVPIPEPENMDDKARNAWVESRNREKQFRAILAQQKRQIEELTGKQSEFQRSHDDLARALKERDDQLKAANEKLGKLDLSGSVEFRKRYDQPLQQAEANLDAAIHDAIEGADTPEQIAQIRNYVLTGDDRQFQEYIAGLDVDTQGKLIEKRRTYKELSAQREQALADWQATSRGLTDAAAREDAAQRTITRQRNAEAAVRRNTTELPENLRPYVVTDDGFADEVKNANEAFTAFMQTATDEELACAAHLGHFVPAMNRALMMALRECREAQEELYRMRGIRNIPTRTATPSAPRPVAKPPAKPTVESLEKQAMDGIEGALSPLMGGAAVPRN